MHLGDGLPILSPVAAIKHGERSGIAPRRPVVHLYTVYTSHTFTIHKVSLSFKVTGTY